MQCGNIADFEKQARRRLPRFVFDFLVGGGEDELTLRANRADFQRIILRPRVLVDVSNCDSCTTVLGERIALPVLLAPTGLMRLASRHGELSAAAAAGREGTIFVLSAASSYSLEEVAQTATGPLWFQLYPFGGREGMTALVQRAQKAGYRALCFTVDTPIGGKRERDLRNGMTVPPSMTWNKVRDVALRPRWLRDYLLGPRITLKNLEAPGAAGKPQQLTVLPQIDQAMTHAFRSWDDVTWLRRQWNGPLIIKGVMTAEDAQRALQYGVDGIIVSNHGGRQLDGVSSTIEALPEIVDAVDGRAEVFLDGGVRRGADVVKAIALGAKACLIGRPYWYGLAANGEEGAVQVLKIFHDEIERVLMLLGRRNLGEVDASAVRRPP
jgi:isopentenyl diphosphate isomerase/L-lactate dehydrogenase-like FMN-dependent dehydrogenase